VGAGAKKNDPSTVKFEKVKDRRYHFAMKHFPFDGDLLVRNVVIEDFSAVNQNGISMGTVEVELQGVTHDFHRTFARSYAQWNMSNTLYWDPKAQQWLTSETYFREVRALPGPGHLARAHGLRLARHSRDHFCLLVL
jgi:hypothetical protein